MIKEFCKSSNRAVIREDAYGSQWSKFKRLVNEAKKDFPDLNEDDVEIIHFGGERYAKTFGIEFYTVYAPDSYSEISQLEYTR